jgi:thioesterase domain-containing protein
MTFRLHELQETLYSEIPITKHLGLTVVSYDDEQLALSAPLEANINHKDTAFAGSLNALVTLSGWGLLWLILKEERLAAKIVIQDSTINYLLPVTKDFVACCRKPDAAQLTRFTNMLKRKGKARLELEAEIREEEQLAVAFKGRYVAQVVINPAKSSPL